MKRLVECKSSFSISNILFLQLLALTCHSNFASCQTLISSHHQKDGDFADMFAKIRSLEQEVIKQQKIIQENEEAKTRVKNVNLEQKVSHLTGQIFCIEQEKDNLSQKLKISVSADEQLVSDKNAFK